MFVLFFQVFSCILFIDPAVQSIVADSIIPLISKLRQFRPLADVLKFQIFPPDEPYSFQLRFDELQDLDKVLRPFKTQ